jgi:hypothetical protein
MWEASNAQLSQSLTRASARGGRTSVAAALQINVVTVALAVQFFEPNFGVLAGRGAGQSQHPQPAAAWPCSAAAAASQRPH